MAQGRRLIHPGRFLRAHEAVRRLDRRVAQLAAGGPSDRVTAGCRIVSKAGGSKAVVAMSAGAAIADAWSRRTQATARLGTAFLVVAVGGQFAISNSIKAVVRRDRPEVLRRAGFSGSSFPSGHATASAASYGAVAVLLTRGRPTWIRAVGAVAAGGVAVAVASTRVVLGVHWASDVVAGLVLGSGWLTAVYVLVGDRWLRAPG